MCQFNGSTVCNKKKSTQLHLLFLRGHLDMSEGRVQVWNIKFLTAGFHSAASPSGSWCSALSKDSANTCDLLLDLNRTELTEIIFKSKYFFYWQNLRHDMAELKNINAQISMDVNEKVQSASQKPQSLRIFSCEVQNYERGEWARTACGCVKLRCPLQLSPSCWAHWSAGLLVWPPYAEVRGSGCQRSSSTCRAVGGAPGGGSWEMLWGGSCSISIVPGGQELSRTQQESGGPFLKSDQLELLFSQPVHFILLCISSTPALSPPCSPPRLSLADCYSGWNVIFLCLSYETALSPALSCIPPTHPTNLFSTGIKLNHGALFSNHLVHIKVTHERMAERRKGPRTRRISLAFPSHNASHLNSPIYCWWLFWMVPLMKCCFCGSSHEFQRPQGYILPFLSLTSKLSGTGRVGMKKLRGHQVRHEMLCTKVLASWWTHGRV